MKEFLQLFEGVSDPRRSNATRHDLHEMLMIALLCVLCGGKSCRPMQTCPIYRVKEARL